MPAESVVFTTRHMPVDLIEFEVIEVLAIE
jgi:hypothetical protein